MNILSLPDDALSLIFRHLNASNTSGSFSAPRPAFMLAQTNTRLFSLFCEHLTRITPQIANGSPATLSSEHILSITRIAGPKIYELHLPQSSCAHLQEVADGCPRLKKLEMIDSGDHRKVSSAFEKLVTLRLRSLSIRAPSGCTMLHLSLLPRTEELCLKNISEKHIPHLIQILREPPKRLHLHIMDGQLTSSPELLSILHTACPNTEELSVSAFRSTPASSDDPFFREATALLKRSRDNTDSSCRSMALEGNVMDLMRHAHPNATVEVTRAQATYICDKGGVFPKSIFFGFDMQLYQTLKHTMAQDFSRIQEVHFGTFNITKFVQPLLSLPLKKVSVNERTVMMPWLRLHVNTVSITSTFFDGRREWDWLVEVEKIEVITRPLSQLRRQELLCLGFHSRKQWNFLTSVLTLVQGFKGKEIWFDFSVHLRVKRTNALLKSLVRKIASSLEAFERRGGDAGTVRALLESIELV